jgi:protein required for attachment to host cells
MNPKAKYWVLVANSGQARILEMQRKPYEFHQVSELFSETQHLTNKEIVSDASGRVYHTQGPGTHSMKPRSDPHEQAEEQFSRGLAQKMEKAAQLGRFDQLLVVADPKTMGRLRQRMNRSLAGKITDEVALDLVGLPLPQLESRLRDVLGWAA